MNPLNTYWLIRGPGAAPEGPFTIGQLKAMYRTGAITAEAQLCIRDEEEWTEARYLLEDDDDMMPAMPRSLPPLPQETTKERMRRYDEEFARQERRGGCRRAFIWGAWIFIALLVFGSIIPSLRERSEIVDSSGASRTSAPSSAIEPSAWDGAVSEAKTFIKSSIRDPSSVKYHEWKNFVTGDRHITTVDFTATNGLGGPSRERWTFSFDKGTGQLMNVFDGSKFLLDVSGDEIK